MMFEVNVYLETSLKGPGTRVGWHAAVLEFIKDGKSVTREDFIHEKQTTYHKSVLCALVNALKRLNTSCFVNIYTDSEYLQSGVEKNLDLWKRNGFQNAKGEPLKNQAEWMQVAEKLSGHAYNFRMTKRHLYSEWMRREAQERFKNEH